MRNDASKKRPSQDVEKKDAEERLFRTSDQGCCRVVTKSLNFGIKQIQVSDQLSINSVTLSKQSLYLSLQV